MPTDTTNIPAAEPYNPAQPSGNLFDQLLADPNGAERVDAMLRNSRMQRNTMSIGEFMTYHQIFQVDGREKLGDAKFDKLAQAYFERVCPYDPVTIVDGPNIVTVLPPVFNRSAAITDLGPIGSDIGQAFFNANALPDELSAEKRRFYMEKYIELLDIAQNDKLSAHVKDISDKMTADCLQTLGRDSVRKTAEVQEIEAVNLEQDGVVPLNEDEHGDDHETIKIL